MWQLTLLLNFIQGAYMKKLLIISGVVAMGASALAQAPTAIDLGTISDTSSVYATPDFTVNLAGTTSNIIWYKFRVAEPTNALKFFDIDTTPQTVGGVNSDLEMGLYRTDGTLVNNDDDSGHSLHPQLSYGGSDPSVSGRTFTFGSLTAPIARSGQQGNLANDEYYLAIGSFNVTFGATNWTVTSSSTVANWEGALNFRNNLSSVPEPASMMVLGLGAVALIKRRRNKSA
jgi:hypothetical protein